MKKVFYILIIIISIFIINSLVRSIYSLTQKQDLIAEARQELQQEKNKHQKLQDQLNSVKRRDFIEEEARNKLFLVKPGEQIVLLPKATQTAEKGTKQTSAIPIWKQWLQVFFPQE